MWFARVVLALAAAARAASAAVDVAAADACVATCGGGGVDSETWYRKKAKKDCGWVGRDAAKVAKRCKKAGVDAALAPPCEDDASWLKDDGNSDKGCEWISDQVARGDPGRQCARARDARGAKAKDACACACAVEPPARYAYEISGATIVDAGAARRRLGGGGRRDAVDDYVADFNGDDAAGPAFCGAIARVLGDSAADVGGCGAGRGPAAGVAAISYVVTVVEAGRWGDTDAFALAALASVRNVLDAAAADGSLASEIADALSFFGGGAPVRVPETVAAWAALGGGDVRCDGGTPAPTSPTPAPTTSAVESGEGAGECAADADCDMADCFSYHGSSSAPPYYVAPCADFADGGTCAAAAPGTAGLRCRGDYLRSDDRANWVDVAGTCALTAGAVACAADAAGTAVSAEAFGAAPSYVAQGVAWEAVDRGLGGGSVYVGLVGAGGDGDGKVPYTFGIQINGHSTSVTEGGNTVYVQNPPLLADGDEFAVLVSANEVSYYFRGAKVHTSAGTADWSDPAGYRVVVAADGGGCDNNDEGDEDEGDEDEGDEDEGDEDEGDEDEGCATGAAVRNVRVLVAQDEPATSLA